MIILSYHPLLMGPPGLTVEIARDDLHPAFDALTRYLDELPDGAAKACMWAKDDDGNPSLVLLLEHGRAIREHLVAWSEGDPPSWFDLQLSERGGLYALALVPNFQKSVDRQLANMALLSGKPVPVPESTHVLFRPLQFVTERPSEVFRDKVRGLLKDHVRVHVADMEDVPEGGPMSLPPESLLELGRFKLTSPSGYTDSLLDQREADGA